MRKGPWRACDVDTRLEKIPNHSRGEAGVEAGLMLYSGTLTGNLCIEFQGDELGFETEARSLPGRSHETSSPCRPPDLRIMNERHSRWQKGFISPQRLKKRRL